MPNGTFRKAIPYVGSANRAFVIIFHGVAGISGSILWGLWRAATIGQLALIDSVLTHVLRSEKNTGDFRIFYN